MSPIYPWLISATAALVRTPKPAIIIPILAVFLLAYNAVYDLSLRPINGHLVPHIHNLTLHDGLILQAPTFPPASALPTDPDLRVVRVTYAAENALRYLALVELVELEHQLRKSSNYVLSPTKLWPVPLSVETPTLEDTDRAEQYILKTLNLDHHADLTALFFDRLARTNHMIRLAERVHTYVYVDANEPLPQFAGSPLLRVAEVHHTSGLARDFRSYYRYVRGELKSVNFVARAALVFDGIVALAVLVHVYLCICNQHKIRSSIGLVIGWATAVITASFASLCVVAYFTTATSWTQVFGPLGSRSIPAYFVATMMVSLRNLFRTINDLAGDNAFGAPENLHRRVIKYYLGFNSSVRNAEGVFVVSSALRRVLMLDRIGLIPVPNTTVILGINIGGIWAVTGLSCVCAAAVLSPAHYQLYSSSVGAFCSATLLALVLDHFLQLTFLVGIVVIDLNRVDLTDLLKKAATGDQAAESVHEVNPISAWLLGLHSTPVLPTSWRGHLGTFCLKVAPVSSKQLWTYWVPLLLTISAASKAFLVHTAIPERLAADANHVVPLVPEGLTSQTYDMLFYSELATVVVFVVAVSQVIFTLTYSKRQRREMDLDDVTALVSPESGLTNAELAAPDAVKYFECITLGGPHASDIVRLQANTKCLFLVSADLDHKVLIWLPLSKVERDTPQNILTYFEAASASSPRIEFWPINRIEISDDGNYVVLINNKHCRIKCFSRKALKYVWEVSLTSEIDQSGKKMHVVTAFFRKRTVAGFLARKLMLKKKKAHARRNSASSIMSAAAMTGNYPPPSVPEEDETEPDTMQRSDSEKNEQPKSSAVEMSQSQSRHSQQIQQSESSESSESDRAVSRRKEYEDELHREEFVLVLESGEMITVACDNLKIKVYNPLTQIYEGQSQLQGLKIISLKLLKTARVNDRIICNLSNDDIIVGTAVNNLWRFHRLEIDLFFSDQPIINFAPPLMSRTGSAISLQHDFSTAFELQRQNYHDKPESDSVFSDAKKYAPINQSTIITIEFVGMVVRVKDLQAQLVDIQTGTIVKVFDIGHFKPGTFRVVHSEPTHCKFCGCASFESISLVYEDFYDKILILQTFTVENKKSRNNICLRVERDPREIRCVGFDSVIEKHFWYDNIEMWEVTDMNVIVGIRKKDDVAEELTLSLYGSTFTSLREQGEVSALRSRSAKKAQPAKKPNINDIWQGFVVTAQNGKLLEYSVPVDAESDSDFKCMRPNYIVKYGFKSVAIAFGRVIKILFLGGEKLIESDLYYSGTTSTLNAILKPSKDGVASSNELLFINKRRKMLEKKIKA